MTADTSWKLTRDPLYRGDVASGVSLPSPSASRSIVRHILYLEGYGRETPYLSASENLATAVRFAGTYGKTYIGQAKEWPVLNVKHRPRKELLQLLRGRGKGDAEWSNAFEVMRARQYVEEAQEHLADFTAVQDVPLEELRDIVDKAFTGK